MFDALGAENDAAGREVGPFDKGHQLFQADFIAAFPRVDDKNNGIGNFGEIMGRNVGRHPDRDATGAIDEQIRQHGRQHHRLFQAVVKVVFPVHRIHLDVLEHGIGNARQTGLGVTHSRRAITINRAEVTLPVNQGVAQAEILRHTRHRVVNRRVTMRVILTQHFTDDTCALLVGSAGCKPHVMHGV